MEPYKVLASRGVRGRGPYKVLASRGVRGRGRFSQSAGRGRASSNSFLGQGQGDARPQQNPRTSATKTQ